MMATTFSGGGSRSTRKVPPTMGKQLVNFITCGSESSAPFEQIAKYLTADNSVFPNDMRVTQDLNSFGEIIAHAQCSVDEKIYIYIYSVCTT
jgi:hypothetical protein